jgi:hypothetical protein
MEFVSLAVDNLGRGSGVRYGHHGLSLYVQIHFSVGATALLWCKLIMLIELSVTSTQHITDIGEFFGFFASLSL